MRETQGLLRIGCTPAVTLLIFKEVGPIEVDYFCWLKYFIRMTGLLGQNIVEFCITFTHVCSGYLRRGWDSSSGITKIYPLMRFWGI